MSDMKRPLPAQTYEEYFVPGVFARWTPVLVGHARLRQGERVLDLACGTGIVARTVAASLGFDCRVVGADINPGLLEVAKRIPVPNGATIEWLACDTRAMPGGEFDVILCQQGFQFFPDPAFAAREILRLIRPGGRAVLSVWEGLEHQPVYRALCHAEARSMRVPLEVVARPFNFGGAARLQRLFVEAGFEVVEVVTEMRDANFPSPDDFVTRTVLGAGAVLPEFAAMSDSGQRDVIDAVKREVLPILEEYVRDGRLVFPTLANVLIAQVRQRSMVR